MSGSDIVAYKAGIGQKMCWTSLTPAMIWAVPLAGPNQVRYPDGTQESRYVYCGMWCKYVQISSQEFQKLWSYTGITGKTPEQDSVAPEKALICEKRKDDVTDSARDACWAKRLPWLEDLPSNSKTIFDPQTERVSHTLPVWLFPAIWMKRISFLGSCFETLCCCLCQGRSASRQSAGRARCLEMTT